MSKQNVANRMTRAVCCIHSEFDVVLTVHRRYYVEIKCQLDATDEFLLQILVLAQHVSGTIMPIISTKYDRQQPLV
jgi:hypothetical protein